MTKKFVVIHEAPADFIIATELADRVLCESIDWLDDAIIVHQRDWIAEESPGVRLAWTTIAKRARAMNIRAHGHFTGKPGLPDAVAARRAIVFVNKIFTDADAILLIRDMDDQQERRSGLEQARNLFRNQVIVIGAANIEREAWILCGFDPLDDDETNRLASERQKLGCDPRLKSQELTAAKNDQALRSPKRVLKVLTNGDFHREQSCWHLTALQLLHERGKENGLSEYLGEIESRLVSLLT